MKIKIGSAIGLIVLFILIVSAQAVRPLYAEECPISCPLTSPLTSPITDPSVSPTDTPSVTPTETMTPTVTPTESVTPTVSPTESVTPSVSPTMSPSPSPEPQGSYKITGTVMLKFMNFFHHGTERMKPAKDVLVTAINVFNGKKFETRTNEDGTYELNPNEAGYYAIHVSEGEAKFFTPPVQFIYNTRPKGKRHVDFEGVVFTRLFGWGRNWWHRHG